MENLTYYNQSTKPLDTKLICWSIYKERLNHKSKFLKAITNWTLIDQASNLTKVNRKKEEEEEEKFMLPKQVVKSTKNKVESYVYYACMA